MLAVKIQQALKKDKEATCYGNKVKLCSESITGLRIHNDNGSSYQADWSDVGRMKIVITQQLNPNNRAIIGTLNWEW